MVGTSPPPGLCSFSPKDGRSVDVKPTRELRIFATKHDQRGWMSENYPSLQRREKCFLLTSPFIEPALLDWRQIQSHRQTGGRHGPPALSCVALRAAIVAISTMAVLIPQHLKRQGSESRSAGRKKIAQRF